LSAPAPGYTTRSEIEVQSELDDSVGKVRRRLADRSEATTTLSHADVLRMVACRRVSIRFSELSMVRQVEEVRRENQTRLLPSRDLELLLQGEVKVINPRVPEVRVKTRSVAKRFGNVATSGQID